MSRDDETLRRLKAKCDRLWVEKERLKVSRERLAKQLETIDRIPYAHSAILFLRAARLANYLLANYVPLEHWEGLEVDNPWLKRPLEALGIEPPSSDPHDET